MVNVCIVCLSVCKVFSYNSIYYIHLVTSTIFIFSNLRVSLFSITLFWLLGLLVGIRRSWYYLCFNYRLLRSMLGDNSNVDNVRQPETGMAHIFGHENLSLRGKFFRFTLLRSQIEMSNIVNRPVNVITIATQHWQEPRILKHLATVFRPKMIFWGIFIFLWFLDKKRTFLKIIWKI